MDAFSRIHVPRSGQNFPRSVIKRTTVVWQNTAFFGVSQRGTQKFASNRGANTQQGRVHGGGEQGVVGRWWRHFSVRGRWSLPGWALAVEPW